MQYPTYPPDYHKSCLAVLLLVALLPALFCSIGCASSSPRFKGRSNSPTYESSSTQQQRFATKVRQEEMAEDDKKVDIEKVKERFSVPPSPRHERSTTIDRKKVMTEILGLIGTPYASGNGTSDGIDCSAFTAHIYEKAIGHNLPRATEDQYKVGRTVGSNLLKFGDLVFFNTTGETPSHVGIFIGEDLFAHASVSFGVTISSLQSSYYKKRYVGARRIID